MYNPTAYEAYKHSLLEPNDRIIVGCPAKHYKLVIPVSKPEPRMTEEEHNRLQDEYVERMQLSQTK